MNVIHQRSLGVVGDDGPSPELVVHEQLLVESRVQDPSGFVRCALVERLGITEQRQESPQDLRPDGQLVAGLPESSFRRCPVKLDASEPIMDLGLGQLVVQQGVEQLLLLDVQLGQLGLEAGVQFSGAGLSVLQHSRDVGFQSGRELVRKSQRAVVLDDGLFDLVGG